MPLGLCGLPQQNWLIRVSLESHKVLVLEPYYGGSHKNFLNGLAAHLPFDFHFLTLPARKWKWRMRFSAPFFAAQLPPQKEYDAIICSTFVDVATLRGIGPSWLADVPVVTYFHENQFAYPVQVNDARDFHFALTNLTTALASDSIAFNSLYNRDSFLQGAEQIIKKAPDMKMDLLQGLLEKSSVLHPGIDFSELDSLVLGEKNLSSIPVVVWNHRWEHDKNPEMFFQALYELDDLGEEFQLMVLGQSFQRRPDVFSQAQKKLHHRILHFGYLENRQDYLRCLQKATVVVSTALHEFYGIAVIEAVRAGCRPLLPNRLSYPELFPSDFLYDDDSLGQRLRASLLKGKLDPFTTSALTERFSWAQLTNSYVKWLQP